MDNNYLLDFKKRGESIKNALYTSFLENGKDAETEIGKFRIPINKDFHTLLLKIFNISSPEDLRDFSENLVLITGEYHVTLARAKINMYRYIFFIVLFLKEREVFREILNKNYHISEYIQFINNLYSSHQEEREDLLKKLRENFFSIVACSFLEKHHFNNDKIELEKEKKLINENFNIEIVTINKLIFDFKHQLYEESSDICKTIESLK